MQRRFTSGAAESAPQIAKSAPHLFCRFLAEKCKYETTGLHICQNPALQSCFQNLQNKMHRRFRNLQVLHLAPRTAICIADFAIGVLTQPARTPTADNTWWCCCTPCSAPSSNVQHIATNVGCNNSNKHLEVRGG